MLGSFPPQRKRWSMDFFYPNFQNDMWRIFGVVFRNDRDYFVDAPHRTFRLPLIVDLLQTVGVALYDTATEVRRLQDNASDKYLSLIHISEPTRPY